MSEQLRSVLAGLAEEDEGMSESEILAHLTDAQRDMYLKLQALFESDGWKILLAQFQQDEINAGIRGANADSWEANRVALGERMVYSRLANLETGVMNDFAGLAQSNQEEVLEDQDYD